jgi:hypothetical protein
LLKRSDLAGNMGNVKMLQNYKLECLFQESYLFLV